MLGCSRWAISLTGGASSAEGSGGLCRWLTGRCACLALMPLRRSRCAGMEGSENIPAVGSLCCLPPYGSVQGWLTAHADGSASAAGLTVSLRLTSAWTAIKLIQRASGSFVCLPFCSSCSTCMLYILAPLVRWLPTGSCPSWPFAEATSPPTHQKGSQVMPPLQALSLLKPSRPRSQRTPCGARCAPRTSTSAACPPAAC